MIDFEWPVNLLDALAIIVTLGKVLLSLSYALPLRSRYAVGTLVFIFIPVRKLSEPFPCWLLLTAYR